ncbi:AraC family transcriptional regulator [Erwinia sp. TH29]|uniref:AraC family transcriptional regulator n=1 Tax=unclassified Erwinia TaxID=2622719 RepID=UPI0019125142|nr:MULTISPECIES: AraC family transcriptional regulator [unclassified Erwinia]MBK5301902.1 AraC family transcriptional regulator [Bacillus sp. TH86]MBK5321671.1 AraC family transcriptional regulator [Bacillus sp. TH59]MBK5336621.1 AraC family transcriptional regulator [Bacillus sp. TH57]MBK5316168.1 AraC family transcriptional regulator [Erwinia sp. TH79]MBK5421028.1 AraC family transcriptional regulator [Erwinia sp. TH29]
MIHIPQRHESPLALNIDPRVSVPGDFATSIPGLSLFRRDLPAPPAVCMIEPSLTLVGRGEKRLRVGGEGYSYGPSRFLVTSLDLPANSEVILASPEKPCVGLVLKLDVSLLAEVITKSGLPAKRHQSTGTGAGIGNMSSSLQGALDRLLALLDEPEAIPVLAPLILAACSVPRPVVTLRCCVDSHSKQKRSATRQVERKTSFSGDAPRSVSLLITMQVNR